MAIASSNNHISLAVTEHSLSGSAIYKTRERGGVVWTETILSSPDCCSNARASTPPPATQTGVEVRLQHGGGARAELNCHPPQQQRRRVGNLDYGPCGRGCGGTRGRAGDNHQ